MYITTNALKLRDNLRAYLDHVAITGDRVLITRHGKDVAALVTVHDMDALEKVEASRETLLEARHQAKMAEFRVMKDAMERDD